MTAAAIQAQLVDVRNLGTEKCIKMTLHVPAEQAMQVLKAFGWPTAVNPVPVAIARLNVCDDKPPSQAREADWKASSAASRTSPDIGTHTRPIEAPRQDTVDTEPVGARKSWQDMPPAQQAGILCNDDTFAIFLLEEHPEYCGLTSAEAVRSYCGVTSRSKIKDGNLSGDFWRTLVAEYRAWMREPEVVG